jgi:hypothetical protein
MFTVYFAIGTFLDILTERKEVSAARSPYLLRGNGGARMNAPGIREKWLTAKFRESQ